MKEFQSKEYKGLYFSNNLDNHKKCTSNKNLNIKKINKKYYESGAHFKYLSLYNELQKLFKIQNYSLPKKKIKKRKDILNSENNKKIKPFFLIDRINKIKSKNKHNVNEKKIINKNVCVYNEYNNNNINSKNIKNNNTNYSSLNYDNNLLYNKSCDNTIKKKSNKDKVFHSISTIKKKPDIYVNNYNYNNFQKVERKKYSSSFVKNFPPFMYKPTKKNLKLNINHQIKSIDNKKNIIKVKTKVLVPTNNKSKM